MQSLAPIIIVPRRFWEREYGACPLPKAVTVTFEVAGQPVDDATTQGFVSVAEDSELRLSGLWAVSQDRFPGHCVINWVKVGDDTIKLQLQPPDSADEQQLGIDRKRQAPTHLQEPQAKVPALGGRLALEWDHTREQLAPLVPMDWRPEGRDGARLVAEPPQRLVAPALLPTARLGARRGGAGGRMRGGSRASATGRGCAKLVRTTTRLYIGVGQVREWLGEVGPRTELQVKVMLDNRLLPGVHQADLLYNKGAHYYWITSRTLKRTAMGKWFLGWSHTPVDGLVLLLRSPSKDEIAAAIAEGFQGKEDDDETEMSEQLQQQQLQQQMLHGLTPSSPRPAARVPHPRGLNPLGYVDEEAMLLMQQQQQQQLLQPQEMEDVVDAAQYHRATPLVGAARHGPGGEEDEAVSGLSGDSEMRRPYGPSDPRLMVALAAAELQRGLYPGGTPSGPMGRRPAPNQSVGPGPNRGYPAGRDTRDLQQLVFSGRPPAGTGPGMGPGQGSGQGQYRDAQLRPSNDGLGAPAAPAAPPRGPAMQPPRYSSFSDVPGGTAFASTPLPVEAHGLEASQSLQQQQQRGVSGAIPTQLGAAGSINSNPSLAGAAQLPPSGVLQASFSLPPLPTPLRLPSNVSELLPPEYLPAAVSVRYTLDGNLQPDVFACEIHRNSRGACYLYNLPTNVLEGRIQQDWMISEDGCLVLCLQTPPQQQAGPEKSVRSIPAPQQGGGLVGGGSVNPDTPTNRGGPAGRGSGSMDRPGLGRPQGSDAELAASVKPQSQEPSAGGAGTAATPMDEDRNEQMQQAHGAQVLEPEAATAATAAPEPQPMIALAVVDRRAEAWRGLPIPRQVLESMYGLVQLPHPVLVRFQVNGEQEREVYLAEAVDGGHGELLLRGVPPDIMVGRTLVAWCRTTIHGHHILIVCLETRPDDGQGKPGTAPAPPRPGRDDESRRSRGDQPPSQQQQGATASQQQQQPPMRGADQSMHWGAAGEGPMPGGRAHGVSTTNLYGQQPVNTQQNYRTSAAAGSAVQRQHQQLQQPGTSQQPLQPVLSGTLPGTASGKLPFSSSVRPDGHGSAAAGGGPGSRPASAGVRGGGMGGSLAGGASGQHALALNLDSSGAGLLQTVASAAQNAMQSTSSRQAATSRPGVSSSVLVWPHEGSVAGQGGGAVGSSVFSQFGDLTVTASDAATANANEDERPPRQRSEDGGPGDDDRHPHRRNVLRVLSVVGHEQDDGDTQQRRN